MADRERPGWARRPDAGEHVVTCPMCGQAMSWARFVEHGASCADDSETEGAPRRREAGRA